MKKLKIAVIDNYDSFVYNLIRYIEEAGDFEVDVMRNNEIKMDTLEKADAILLSPGPGIPSEAGMLMEIIDKFHTSKPIIGVCLGHQALAEFFGNSLEQCANPHHGEASTIKILQKDKLFNKLPSEIEVGRYHSWKVTRNLKLPLIISALSHEDEIMAFEHESLPIFGVQFHPESILTPSGRTIIGNWILTLGQKESILN